MKRVTTWILIPFASLTVSFAARPAAAALVCGTIADFNNAMAANGSHATDVTLSYDVVGVNPADFLNTKGSLGQMRNTACNGGADATIKVYGNSEPLNTAHLPGTLKLEYGNSCCPGTCSEGWASPNPSQVIFVNGSEQCKVTMWVKPATIGYKLECGGAVYDAVGDNTYQNAVNQITVLDYLLPGGGSTWGLPNATATNDQVCYDGVPVVGSGAGETKVAVLEDVTTGPSHANSVFPDVNDLAVEAADNEAYLKFLVPKVAGKITQGDFIPPHPWRAVLGRRWRRSLHSDEK